jgi:hypothetical protein
MSYIVFPLFFSSIVYIFATIENHSYTKWLILILGLLIFINYYFYKKIVMIIRKTYVKKINYYLSIILIFLTFFNIENFKEVIKIINQNIKNNFNQKIFFEIKNFLNTTSYFYSFSIIFIMGIIFLSAIIYNKKNNNKVEENNEEIKLLSFREKEKDKLKSMIENKKISTILIEAEIGNGKTTLINSLFKDLQTQEIIYLKLPLIKSVDELKRNLFLELQKIFLKNDLDNQFLNAFFDNISAFKLGFLEINFGKKENMWNTIQKLQKTLKKLDKNIIIVLDDIERENDTNKIYESILFLGELSEYFKDTKTTTLLLAQYSYLEDKLKEINKDTLYLEKYYKYKFKLNEPTAIEFLDKDYKLLIEEAILTSTKLLIDENFKDAFIDSIIENISIFFQSFHIYDIKLNVRAFEKSIKKIIYLYKFYKDNPISYSILTYCILKETFYIIIEKYILKFTENQKKSLEVIYKESLKFYSNNSLKNCLKFDNSSRIFYEFLKEIEKIIRIYNKGEILVEEFELESCIIKKVLNGEMESPKIFFVDGYEEYIFNLVKGNLEKINLALEKNIIEKKTELIKIINSIDDSLKLSKGSIDNMKKILLKQEYTWRNIEDNNIFIQKISEIEDFKPNLHEIIKLLDEDDRQLKKKM